jgi:hypothetical protein
MKRFSALGFVIGVPVGVFIAGVFWIIPLIGAPSQFGPRFPVAKEPFPTNACAQVHSGREGFDIYTNIKVAPVIRKDERLPVLKRRSWNISEAVHVEGGRRENPREDQAGAGGLGKYQIKQSICRTRQ